MKHTPAPWKAELLNKGKSNEHWRIGNEDAGNAIVAECMDYVSDPLERDANAKLIELSPTLLAVAKTFVRVVHECNFVCKEGKLENRQEFIDLAKLISVDP